MKVRWRTGPRTRGRAALGLWLSLASLPAAAQVGPLTNQSLFFDQAANTRRSNYLDIDGGLTYSDNVTRVRNGSADELAMLGLVGDTSRQGPRVDYRLASDLVLVKYLRSSYQTQPFGYLDGTGDFGIVPGLFSWTGRETYTQTIINPLAPVTPDNLESLNYATTGPRFTLHPTLRTMLTLDGGYSYIYSHAKSSQYIDISNHRYTGNGTLNHAFSNTSSAYLSGSYEKVYFHDQVNNTNFSQYQGIVGYKFGDARTTLDIGGGFTKLHAGNQKPGGANWQMELTRQISPASRLSLIARQQVTDAANMFRLNLDQPVPSTAPDRLTTSDPFTDRELGATWRFTGARTTLTLSYLDIHESYKIHPISDRTVKDASAFVTRRLSPVLDWDIGGDYWRQNFALGNSSNTINAITSLRWQVGRHLRLRFLYGHSALTPHGYAENQVGVMAYYAVIEGTQQDSTQPAAQPATLRPL